MVNFRKINQVLLITLRMSWRAAREDFLPLVVAPILLGGIYFAFRDIGSKLYAKLLARASVDLLAANLPFWTFLISVSLLVAALPNLIKEIFAHEPDAQYLRTLPLQRFERFLIIFTGRGLRNLVPALFVGYLVWRLRRDIFFAADAGSASPGAACLPPVLAGFLFAGVQSPLEIILVMALARLRALTWTRFSAVIASGLALSYVLHRHGWDAFNPFLYPFWPIREGALARAADYPGFVLTGLVTVLLLFIAAERLFDRGVEAAWLSIESVPRRERRFLGAFLRIIPDRLLDRPVAALLKRDLILTLRVFHRGLLFNCAVALFFLALLAYLIVRYRISAGPYLLVLSTGTCALSAFSLSLIAARLLQYQMDFIWIDQSSHLEAESLWLSKVLFTNTLSLGAPVLTMAAVAVFARLPWMDLAYLCAVNILITIQVASFTGSLIYEFERHPVLALFFCFMASIPLAIFIVVVGWWIIFFVFPLAMHYLKNRGLMRIKNILKYA